MSNTIWDWNFHRMDGAGRYVTLSRARSCEQVQIAPDGDREDNDDNSDDGDWLGPDDELQVITPVQLTGTKRTADDAGLVEDEGEEGGIWLDTDEECDAWDRGYRAKCELGVLLDEYRDDLDAGYVTADIYFQLELNPTQLRPVRAILVWRRHAKHGRSSAVSTPFSAGLLSVPESSAWLGWVRKVWL